MCTWLWVQGEPFDFFQFLATSTDANETNTTLGKDVTDWMLESPERHRFGCNDGNMMSTDSSVCAEKWEVLRLGVTCRVSSWKPSRTWRNERGHNGGFMWITGWVNSLCSLPTFVERFWEQASEYTWHHLCPRAHDLNYLCQWPWALKVGEWVREPGSTARRESSTGWKLELRETYWEMQRAW